MYHKVELKPDFSENREIHKLDPKKVLTKLPPLSKINLNHKPLTIISNQTFPNYSIFKAKSRL